MASIEKDLRNAEKAIVKLRNKLKKVDMNYTVQVSISSTDPTTVIWQALVTPPANSLAPISFIEKSPGDLIDRIKATTKAVDLEAVDKAYHESQIEACKRTIKGHEEYIQELMESKRPDEESKSVTEDGSE